MTIEISQHANEARRITERISGDKISGEMTPVVVAELMEAQVHATLAIAERLDTLIGLIFDEGRAIGVRDADRV